jgi:phenylacetate-CoA ligase
MVISGAEVLTERMREQIANAFGAPVYDTYGCHELGRIATECRHTGVMHICDDSVIVDVERENGSAQEGESGSVIATSLHSWTMPFIRYELGDVAVRGGSQCDCGLPFSTLTEISGRKYDYFRAADGSAISPHLILDTVQMDAVGWIERYQFIQEKSGRVVMPIVPSSPPSDAQLTELSVRMRTALGPGVEFEHQLVDTLEFEPGGKTRRFKSELESDYE